MLKRFINGIFAGLLIVIGGSVFLATDNKIAGAVFFATALLCICMKGYSLYTGKICYMADDHSAGAVADLLLGLLGNLVATVIGGLAIRYAIPSIGSAAETLCSGKLEGQTFWQTVIRAIFCGILIYLSVAIFKEKNTPIGILFCIPTFILSGFEHSIADMFYFAASGKISGQILIFIAAVLLGNTVGGLLLPVLAKAGRKEKTNG